MNISRLGLLALLAVSLFSLPLHASAGETIPLRVVTYNVKLGIAQNLEKKLPERFKRVASLARMLSRQKRLKNFDILGLQEICSNEGAWQLKYFDDFLTKRDGQTWMVFGREDPDTSFMCERGAAIYSRFPITDSGLIRLPFLNQARSAVWADIQVPSKDGGQPVLMRVYNAHLDTEARPPLSNEAGRLIQTRAILDHLLDWRREHPTSPVIFLGDMNSLGKVWDWRRREAGILESMKYLHTTMKDLHHTHIALPNQIDWIFYDGLEKRKSKVVHVIMSDHYPVMADFELHRP